MPISRSCSGDVEDVPRGRPGDGRGVCARHPARRGCAAASVCSLITVPRLVEPLALARLLRRAPPAPTVLVRLLGRAEVELAFRELVRRLLPDDEPAILGTGRAWHDRDAERVWAFCSAFEQRYFPLYECEVPEQLLYCIRVV